VQRREREEGRKERGENKMGKGYNNNDNNDDDDNNIDDNNIDDNNNKANATTSAERVASAEIVYLRGGREAGKAKAGQVRHR